MNYKKVRLTLYFIKYLVIIRKKILVKDHDFFLMIMIFEDHDEDHETRNKLKFFKKSFSLGHPVPQIQKSCAPIFRQNFSDSESFLNSQ